MTTTRREALGAILGAGASVASAAQARPIDRPQPAAPGCAIDWSSLRWGVGFEGQRKADLGDETFLNPIVSGDHPDPSILRDGSNYFLTFSSFDAYPGLPVWRSTDLVNWQPLSPSLTKPVGSVWAPELVRHGKTGSRSIFMRAPPTIVRYTSSARITSRVRGATRST